MTEPRVHLLPVYVLAAESSSMAAYIGELNAGLAALHDALLAEPMAAANVRLSVIGFSDTAVLRMHQADLRQVSRMPLLVTHRAVPRQPTQLAGATSYGAALHRLLRQIPRDVAALKQERYAVHRPAVVFLSDGQPSDGAQWVDIHRRLTDRGQVAAAPNIIACGVGEAKASTILDVATDPRFAFVAVPGTDVGKAVAKFCTALTTSVVATGRALANGRADLSFDKPECFVLAVDAI